MLGDTRPPNEDDNSGYPQAIIDTIYADLGALSPVPDFAISTGDYMFASTTSGNAAIQMGYYLSASLDAGFHNPVYPAMGNQECDGATADNCGPGSTAGITENYDAFLQQAMNQAYGLSSSTPYYSVNMHSSDSSNPWTAKFVVVACNAWSSEQASWLAQALAPSTTYTFLVQHEGTTATTAPCNVGSSGVPAAPTIAAQYAITLQLSGHTHTYEYLSADKEVIVGNAGAPLSGSVDYGYVTFAQQADGDFVVKEYDFNSNAIESSFTLSP